MTESAIALVLLGCAIGLARLFVNWCAARNECALPLSLFRIGYGLVLLGEVGQMYCNASIIGPEMRLAVSPLVSRILLLSWMLVIVLLILGFHTKLAAGLNYLFSLWAWGAGGFIYHADHIYLGVNALLPFMPIANYWSLDARRREMPKSVNQFYGRLIILVGIAFMYFDSSFYKLASPLWIHGLGIWEPASFPPIVWVNVSWLLNQKWLMLMMGYLVLAFEATFIVLMWVPRLRTALFFIGTGLHLSIAIILALPWFGLLMCSLYLLMLPECLIPKTDSTNLRPLHRGWALAAAAFLFFLQLVQTSGNPALWLHRQPGSILRLASLTNKVSRHAFGITPHNVFLDQHFRRYRAVITLVDDGKQLLYRPDGEVAALDSGRINTNWLERSTNKASFCELATRVASARASGRGSLIILAKHTDEFLAWQPNWLTRQSEHSWIEIGRLERGNGAWVCNVHPNSRIPGNFSGTY